MMVVLIGGATPIIGAIGPARKNGDPWVAVIV
jgi:hypothetical protein